MKGYRDNGGVGGGFGARNKTVYDDVFGGPPKFGATTLPPRLEDYTEIFQGFHASRGSSIPVLDLPPPLNGSDDVWFDLQSSKLDYSEVFGGFNGLDFAVSYEELFKSSKVVVDDSSDEAWTPAQSESHSDELDPYASLETNQHVSTADPIESFGVKLQNESILEAEKDISNGITIESFGVELQNESILEAEKDISNEITNDSQILDGSIELESQTLPTKTANEKMFSLANNDYSSSNNFNGVTERKQLKKSLSQPLHIPHLSVSDLSLKTQPSQLPPPSRPPPALSSKKGDMVFSHSKLKTSKSYAFEKMTGGDRSPPYFDVEIDASSSAAADAAAMKDAVEQAQAKLRSAKELMDRKKESLQSRSKLRVENNVGDKKERVNPESNGFEGEITKGSLERDQGAEQNDKVVLESFEQKEDFKNVPVREVCGLEENNEKQETLDGFYWEEEHKKQPTLDQSACEPRSTENTFLDKETKTPSEADENESYDNLIEIQIKDNEMEPVVQLQHNTGSPQYDKEEDYDIALQEAFEKEHEKELKESKEEDYNIALQEAFEKEHEKELKESKEEDYNIALQEAFEKEHVKELKESKEEDYDISLQEAFEKQHEKELKESKDEILHEENGKVQKNQEREESERSEEVVSDSQGVNSTEEDESSTGEVSEASDVVDQEGNNVILQQNIPIEKKEATPQTLFSESTSESKSSINLNHGNGTKPVMDQDESSRKTNNGGGGQNRESEKLQRERERLRKLEEERERQIEREKDRMAIDRDTLEARERAFSETRERAAVERATAEFRQRALAEARERLEKACAEARERSLAEKTMEGRLRVEKATQEARERAQRSVEDKFQSMGSFRFSQNASYNGGESESPQRCKARLERHQRTADRAAKALAEKNMRDLLAQKEQAERNRLAESLDAEVKRWCSGKQGNLRALLSTLQYILGSESGWQAVPLTEVITTAAVKKAYRKATLCVHPDKLQQRGASIQQKYICEKVFDLLKEAWNKFNSEER